MVMHFHGAASVWHARCCTLCIRFSSNASFRRPELSSSMSVEEILSEAYLMSTKLFFLVCASAILSGAVAKADTIGPGGCTSCLGSSYTLSYATTTTANVFDVTLVVDASGFSNPSSDLLNSVSLKVSSATPTATLISAPTGFSSTIAGGLSAGGCNGSGSGFFCSESSGLGLAVGQPSDIYSFTWAVTVANAGVLFTGVDEASVKALYVGANGRQNGITSENITLDSGMTAVPEPTSIALFGSGLLAAAGAIKRRLAA